MRSLALILIFGAINNAAAQGSGTTALVLRINPESRLDPQQITLDFQITSDRTLGMTSKRALIAAAVRPLPGQQIHVTARFASLTGPDGPIPASILRWDGVAVNATGGGQYATCSSGVFSSGAAQDLVMGWNQPGTVTCSVNFQLADERNLRPGAYSGVVTLAVERRLSVEHRDAIRSENVL